MKNLLLLFLFVSSLTMAQLPELTIAQKLTSETSQGLKGPKGDDCVISGPVVDGNLYTFSLPQWQDNNSSRAQCIDCYDWDITGFSGTPSGLPVIQHSNTDKRNTFTVEAIGSGTFTIKVTYFNETGCHTCQKNVTVTVAEPPCFEPNIEGKVDCFPGGSTNNLVKLVGTNNVSEVTWVFNPLDNVGYYQGFSFNNGTTLPDGRSFVTSTSNFNDFQEFFSLDPGANCAPGKEVCLRMLVTFNDNTCGGDWEGSVCEFFTIPAPFTVISPNPAVDTTNISFNNLNGKNVTLKLFDLNGELLKSDEITIDSNSFSKELALPTSSSKVLLLKVIENGKVIDTKKILRK